VLLKGDSKFAIIVTLHKASCRQYGSDDCEEKCEKPSLRTPRRRGQLRQVVAEADDDADDQDVGTSRLNEVVLR
jgi:hypothetical protein